MPAGTTPVQMLRELVLSSLLVAALAAALIIEAVWGYALAAVIAVVIFGAFLTGWWPDERRRT